MPSRTVAPPTITDLLFEKADAGLCLVAPDGTVIRANSEWLRSTRFSADEVIGEDIVALFPETRDLALALHARARAGHRVEVPRHAQTVNGRETWWEGCIEPVAMEGGTGLLITAREVSVEATAARMPGTQLRTLASVVESERKYSTFFEISPFAIALNTMPDGTFVAVNDAFVKLFEFTREEVIGKRSVDLGISNADSTARVRAELQQRGAVRGLEVTRRTKSGATRVLSINADCLRLGGQEMVLSTVQDLTERKRAEEAFGRTEAVLQYAGAMAHLGAWWIEIANPDDLGSNPLRWSDEVYRIFGFAPREVEVSSALFFEHVHPEDRSRVSEAVAVARASRTPYRVEHRIVRRDGVERVVLEHATFTFDATGRPSLLVGAVQDVTERKRAEEDLRAAEERFRALATASSDVVYRMNADWTEMWHLVGRDFVADTDTPTTSWLQKYVPPDEQARVTAAIDDAVRNKRTFELEHRVVQADGAIGWTFSRAIPLLDARAAITEWYGMASDVTGRKRAEEALRESESFYRQTLESIPGMVFTTRPDGYCDYQSQQWVDYTGVPMSEHLGDGWNTLLHPDDRAGAFARWQAAVQRTARYDLEYRVRRKDGEYEWFRVIGRPIRDEAGTIVRWFGVAMNIEAMKRTEEALRDADRRKDEFLAMLSHELRNPLAPIRNSTYVLQHALPGSEQSRRAKQVIQRQTEHLTRLVDDLLDVTRIARGKIELRRECVDLRVIALRAADDFGALMEDRGIVFGSVLASSPVWVEADATRLTQVIGNLLHNASKFSGRGGSVTLSLRDHGGEAEISVRDNGAGIDPAVLPRLFNPFVQAEQTLARAEGGLGLGLALVKGITELHGGKVRAMSAGKGKGAEFAVRLPLAPLAAIPIVAPKRACGTSVKCCRVLVVDDNADSADSLAELVRLLGHAVEVAYDGPTAVEKALATHPDVVLCDVGLPGMSGYEVARTLRARGTNAARLVALTGYTRPDDVKRATEAGFDAHVAKPCDVEQIERLLS